MTIRYKLQKKGQEELVGFAVIIVIVSVIMLFLLVFSLRGNQKESIESFEVDSFIQSFLQYTTDCGDNLEYFSIQDLIFECDAQSVCLDERKTCDVLNSTLSELAEQSWKTGSDRPIKGYVLNITVNGNELLSVEKGNRTNSYKGALQDFAKSSDSIKISFRVYD